ncbi:MAG: PAS domain S-box protein [Pedobacter sp.]|nr:MAG: PAS domain S-box protein [Pedobacter sp.]
MNLKDTPIRQKLMSVILLTCSVILLLMCSAFILFEFFSFRNTVKNNISTLGGIIASNSSAALAFDNAEDANEILNALKADKHIVAACLYDKEGNLFAKYPENISSDVFPAKPQFSGYRFEDDFMIGYEPVVQQGAVLGTLYIKSDMEVMYTQLKRILFITFFLVIGSLIIAFFLSNFLQKIISKPILALKQTTRIVSENQNYAVRAVKMGKDELGDLTDAFNQMLTQIEKQNIEIKQAEEASAKLAAIVESSDDAIIGQTLDGIITSWNKSAERMFGYTASEMIDQPIFKLMPGERLDEGQQILNRINEGERIENFETQRLTKNNKLLDVSVTISTVKDPAGNIKGLSKIARDITEKKQEEIRKNDFIAIVSHELKTPLTSLKSYIQILLAMAKKENAEFGINALSRAEMQINKMTNMVQDFLNLARLEGGNILVKKEPFALELLIEEALNETQFLTTNHTIVSNTCSGISINADKEKLSQVLINLIGNAIKYAPNGGNITINCTQHGEKVRIAVSDEGVGISMADQKKLFNRFYRVKNEKVKNVSGFGIGLYLVSEIVRNHDSKIEVESEEGIGSTFYFDLEISKM